MAFIFKAPLIFNQSTGVTIEPNNTELFGKVSPSQIILKDDLNKIGLFRVSINLHSEVQASLSIKIDKIQSK